MTTQIEKKFTLQVPSQTENLTIIREFVTGVGKQAQMSPDDLSKFELAVDEACSNVIEHAYAHDLTKEIIVRAVFDEERITVSVIDTGKGFDPNHVPQKTVDVLIKDRSSGGLGLRLIQTVMDEVRYEIVPGEKNELHMIKKLKK